MYDALLIRLDRLEYLHDNNLPVDVSITNHYYHYHHYHQHQASQPGNIRPSSFTNFPF